MKKLLIAALILLMLTLTACGTASNGPQPDPAIATEVPAEATSVNPPAPATDSATIPVPPVNAEGTISVQAQLIIGTYKLDGTAQAITAEQAAALITLWQSLKDALTSPSSTQDQIELLTTQIQAVMTPEQLQAITNLNLTQDAVVTFMQEQGITMEGPQNANGRQQGSPPQGTPPAGGPRIGFNFVPPELIDAFLQFLQTKASS